MLAVLLVGQFMTLLDVYIANIALPSISTDLHATGSELQLVVGGFVVAYAMLLITGARLGALYGRRRMYLAGIAGFTLASLGCGLAPTAAALIAFRVVQGAGAAVLVPQIMSVIQVNFRGRARATALGLYTVVLSAGAVAGLVIGGAVVGADLFGAHWRPAFLVNVPIGAVLLALVPRLVPADPRRAPGAPARRLDPLGLVLAVSAVVALVLPLVLGRQLGWPAWTFAAMAGGVLLGAAFWAAEKRIAARGGDPLLDPASLRTPGLGVGAIAIVCCAAPYGALLFVLALHLQADLGYGPMRAGLTFLPFAAAFGLVGLGWRRLPARVHGLLPAAGALLSVPALLGIAAGLRDGTGPGPLAWTAFTLFGAALGLIVSPALNQSLAKVEPRHAADASGLLTTAMQVGQLAGMTGVGALYLGLAGPGARTAGHAVAASGVLEAGLMLLGVLTALALRRATR
ncbi:hypothetical protein BIV57_09500 [Mangrovactinospora gilvigrisea]|uniref:Major facilitator superfamily (MFS) profile domain-containing protein n=2 Tax=Mangrovactinospora gilvigrisea TaxID=1428644 RepID=A0A1J7BWJ9_9ACTN|nr:hypothetical protein BIV57_09500 [Mangrovactinospora gilvigrisea]